MMIQQRGDKQCLKFNAKTITENGQIQTPHVNLW